MRIASKPEYVDGPRQQLTTRRSSGVDEKKIAS